MKNKKTTRRSFINKSLVVTSSLALTGLSFKSKKNNDAIVEGLYVIGPKKGFTPLIGTLISMFENMSYQVKKTVKDLSMEDLDFHFDDNSNTIGALILHITSSEKFHQVGTGEERELNEEELKFWGTARKLADPSSKDIKGHEIDYYLNIMDEVRAETLELLKQKDDEWLLSLDPSFSSPERPVNKFWRLFHACEHMSNHNGQIKFLKSRLPSRKQKD